MSKDFFSHIDELNCHTEHICNQLDPISRSISSDLTSLYSNLIPRSYYHGQSKTDKSDYFASVTCLNGNINGSPGPYCLDFCPRTLKYYQRPYKGYTWLSDAYLKLMKSLIII